MEQQSKKALPFFGVGKILPFVKKYKWIIFLMIGCGLMGESCRQYCCADLSKICPDWFLWAASSH